MKIKIWKLQGVSIFLIILGLMVGCGSPQSSSSSSSSSSSGGGTLITSTVSSPKDMQVGDIMAVSIDNNTAVSFEGVSSSAEFSVAIGSYASSGASSTVVMSDLSEIEVGEGIDPVVKSVVNPESRYDAEMMLNSWLRGAERDISLNPPEEVEHLNLSAQKSTALKSSIGHTRNFKVLNSLSSLSSYATVEASLVYIGTNLQVYLDTRATSSLTADQIADLGAGWDRALNWEIEVFGEPSDVDGNDSNIALLTPQINILGGMAGGIITGYFYGADLYSSGSNPVSNQAEIVYALVPDPSGTYGTQISNEFAVSNLLPGVIPHEFQHLINYAQHVIVRGGSSEDSWLNEALSHFTEDIVGYGVENPSRVSLFLSSPDNTQLVASGSPDLYERGASYLFMRYLYEQSSDGDSFLGRLVQTTNTGVDNLEAAFQGSTDFDEFSEFFSRWAIALMATDLGITRDSRYVYNERTRDATTGNWKGVCLRCTADDNRGTTLTGPYTYSYSGSTSSYVYPSSLAFYDLTLIPTELNFSPSRSNSQFAIIIRTR